MDVKEAVMKAKLYVGELFSEEQIANLGLEEVEFDDIGNAWCVTVGFSRPWNGGGELRGLLSVNNRTRSFKIVRISDETGKVVSVKERVLQS